MTTPETPFSGGVVVPLLTPFNSDGEVDDSAFRTLIRRVRAAGVDAVFVGGSAGMGPMLTDAQWERAVAVAAEETAGKLPLLVGVIATSTQRALRQIEVSRRLGAPVIVVTPTFYISLKSDAEMLSHFEACRAATDQEMVIYNIPSCTGSVISPAVVRKAAESGWTRFMKESSGDRDYFAGMLALSRELDLVVLQGNEPDIAWGLESGAGGIVPVCANCVPELFVAARDAARAADGEALQALQSRIDAVRDAILIGDHNWIAGLACALGLQGVGNGIPLLPLQPAGEARKERIRGMLSDASHRAPAPV